MLPWTKDDGLFSLGSNASYTNIQFLQSVLFQNLLKREYCPMGQIAPYCILPFVAQLSVFDLTTANITIQSQAGHTSAQNHIKGTSKSPGSKKITLSSTKERIEGLGWIARNWAFFDISTLSSNSFFFSFIFSGSMSRKERLSDCRYIQQVQEQRYNRWKWDQTTYGKLRGMPNNSAFNIKN